jgi:hypothetical protein
MVVVRGWEVVLVAVEWVGTDWWCLFLVEAWLWVLRGASRRRQWSAPG